MNIHEKRMFQLRIDRAKYTMQNMETIERNGHVWIGNPLSRLDKEQYKRKIRDNLVYRINMKYNDNKSYENAARACDIIKNGERSKWWFARNSTSRAGGDLRGIVHYIRKYKSKILTT